MTKDIEAVSYCVGMSIAGSLMQQDLDKISPSILAEAISDIFTNKTPKYNGEEANQIIQNYIESVNEEKFAAHKNEGIAFLAANNDKTGVIQTASGLQYEVIAEGNGQKPNESSTVKVHYHGTLIDGTVFDSSYDRGNPATFGVNQVIKGWTEALQLMSVGAKYKLYIPENLAYGATPHPGGPIKPYMTLIFDVELLEILS
jgi:FKBP-type peptidyl-prolyl cis-trans isomerase FklB